MSQRVATVSSNSPDWIQRFCLPNPFSPRAPRPGAGLKAAARALRCGMLSRRESSRSRYQVYRAKRRAEKPETLSHRLEEPSKKKRSRTFLELFRTFWTIIKAHRPAV